MRGDVDVKAGGAQRSEIGDGRLRARQDHKIDVAGQCRSGPQPDQIDRRLGLQRIEIIEIGDVRQDRHRDAHPRLRFFRPLLFERQRIFGGQPSRIGEKRNQSERCPTGHLRDTRHCRGKERGIAAKFVDDEAADQMRIFRRDHRLGADQARNDAAAMLDTIFTIKFVHVLAASVLFGAWLAAAVFMALAHRSANTSVVALTSQFVVSVEKIIIMAALVLLPLSGFPLAYAIGLSPFDELWIDISLPFYAVIVVCWIAAWRCAVV